MSRKKWIVVVLVVYSFFHSRQQLVFSENLPAWVAELLYAERSRLDRTVDAEYLVQDVEQLDERYSPESARVFNVHGFYINEDAFNIYTTNDFRGLNVPELVRIGSDNKRKYLFLVHPLSQNFYRSFLEAQNMAYSKPDIVFQATPTASMRSLVIWEKGHESVPFFAKLSMDIQIGESIRTIPNRELARCVGLSLALKQGLPTHPEFDFVEEPLGLIPAGLERGGMLYRRMNAPVSDQSLVPLFALYGKGTHPKTVKPLLFDLIKQSGLSAKQYLETQIFRPFLSEYLKVALHEGIIFEVHAQNVLAKIRKGDGTIAGYSYRDMGGGTMDYRFRIRKGENFPMNLPRIDTLENTYLSRSFLSLIGGNLEYYYYGGFVTNLIRLFDSQEAQAHSFSGRQVNNSFFRILNQVAKEELGLTYELNIDNLATLGTHVRQTRDKIYPWKSGEMCRLTREFIH